jgi:type VI secretion system protein ImpG
MPERFLFVDIAGLKPALSKRKENEIEIAILLGRDDPSLHNVIDASNFALHCTPAINVFPMQGETIHLSDRRYEYHVVPDRTRPMDYEVYDVSSVEGTGTSERGAQPFAALYAAPEARDRHPGLAYFTTQRVPRVIAESQRRKGTRSTYIGTEVFLSIVDGNEAPWDSDLRQLAVKLRCTNRDLPVHLVLGQGTTDFTLSSAAPVQSVRCVAGPTAPSASFVVDPDDPAKSGEFAWRLINHLSLNYLSLTDSADGKGAEALRELLTLYAPVATAAVRKQIDGVRSVSSSSVVRRIKGSGPLAFGRGIEIENEASRRLGFLSEASRLLTASLDSEATLLSVARLSVPFLADWCLMYILDDSGSMGMEHLPDYISFPGSGIYHCRDGATTSLHCGGNLNSNGNQGSSWLPSQYDPPFRSADYNDAYYDRTFTFTPGDAWLPFPRTTA